MKSTESYRDLDELLDIFKRFKEEESDFYDYYTNIIKKISKTRRYLKEKEIPPQDQFFGIFQA